MKRFMAIICSLFLVTSLFAEWKEIEVPSTAVHTVRACKNAVVEVVERNFPEMDYHDIVISFGECFYVFPYSEELWNEIMEKDVMIISSIEELAERYDVQLEYIK